jgi:GNAT superfamily N-acetyltransferase
MTTATISANENLPAPVQGGLTEWREVLRDHYKRLSMSSRRKRFHAAMREDTLDTVAERSSPDLLLGIECNDVPCAVLEIHRTSDGHAEIAISVEDNFQGLGYGSRLFEAGIEHAKNMKIHTADLYYQNGNTGIARLVGNAGGKCTVHGADVCAQIDLRSC